MSGLLSGLGKLGLKNLEGMDLYEEEKKAEQAAKAAPPVMQEADYLFDKTYECPICGGQIKARTMKSGKAKLLRADVDLRPVYENIEPLKYDVVLCPHCGYAAFVRYFKGLTAFQTKAIKEAICASFQPIQEEKETYTYEEAINRYKLCLANAIVKHAKASEKAYICLKAGWLLRSMKENLDSSDQEHEKKAAEAQAQEDEFLKNALDGFLNARESENFPMCGMDEITVDYLIAALAMEQDRFDVSSRIISNILVSPSATSRMKDKARDLKEMLVAKMNEKNAN